MEYWIDGMDPEDLAWDVIANRLADIKASLARRAAAGHFDG